MSLPMPQPTVRPLKLVDYKVLSFDVYGTLIEYKAHILGSFQKLLSRLPADSPYLNAQPVAPQINGSASVGSVEFLKLFQRHEDAIKLEKPVKRFDAILVEIWKRIALDVGVQSDEQEALDFGSEANIASWPTFNGSVEALEKLGKHYKLIALSNIDHYAWSITGPASGLGNVSWWKVFTAEAFGDDLKKADDAKLETTIRYVTDAGIGQEKILHVAQSLGHDHAPAKRLGLSSVFLAGDGPTWGKESESKMAVEKELVGYGWRFASLPDFADVVEAEWQPET